MAENIRNRKRNPNQPLRKKVVSVILILFSLNPRINKNNEWYNNIPLHSGITIHQEDIIIINKGKQIKPQ